MAAVEAVDVTDEAKALDPFVHSQKIEVRCTDEWIKSFRFISYIACFVADSHCIDLVVEVVSFSCGRHPHSHAEIFGQAFALFVEHQENDFRLALVALDVVSDFSVLEQIVVNLLDGLEFVVRPLYRHERVRMAAVEAVDVTDEAKALYPFVHSQKIEVRCTDEKYRCVEAMKKSSNVGQVAQFLTRHVVHPPVIDSGLANALRVLPR